MTFQKISVLVPTRGRPAHVRQLLDSFTATVPDPDRAELVFRIDDDDPATAAQLIGSGWTIATGSRLDGYRSLPAFFEDCRHAATGDLLMLGNDDMRFVTPDWPTRIITAANRYRDGIFVLGVTTYNASHFPFGIVSRAAADAMGYLTPPDIFWGDVFLRDVMNTFGRAIAVANVEIAHDWMGWTPDATFRDAQQDYPSHTGQTYWPHHRVRVLEAVRALQPLCLAVHS